MADEKRAQRVSHWTLVRSPALLTPEIIDHDYAGQGTAEDPYIVDWIKNDPRNPMLMPTTVRWLITMCMAFGTLSVSFASTVFSGALPEIQKDLHTSVELSILTVSLFVLGFAIGPMTWAPLSELYGRQIIYAATFTVATIFGGASIASQNITTLLVLRFFAGAIGASAIVNAAGVIADIFPPRDRGLAITVYCSAPFLGPTLGPLIGGFLSETSGWRWTDALSVFFIGALLVLGVTCVPETYAPYLLSQRAKKLSKMTGKVYKSKLEAEKGPQTARKVFSVAMQRPWILLFSEPIVAIIAVYSAIIYGILYLTFAAFPIVFGRVRGWSQGITGLSFIGVMVGQIAAIFFYIYLDHLYRRKAQKHGGMLPAEDRLIPALVGAPVTPIGLFWFAWTTYKSIPWIVPILGGTLFGFGQVLLFIGMMNYTIDAYTIFAASALAANAILRALFGMAFPLFTTAMYDNLGVQWASSIPAFLALACAPLPFLFYRVGKSIRDRCKYSAESTRIFAAIIAAQKAHAAPAPPPAQELPVEERKEVDEEEVSEV